MYSTPFIVNEDRETEYLERVPMGGGFTESWLQRRLFENPQSLPLGEIDPAYQSVCPLCIEMNTRCGPIDIVYVTPQGRLVIVETKLWRNPDARRKVVGQVLDYAKELVHWSFADLQREVSRRTGFKGNAPYELIKRRYQDIDEAQFVDGVTQSLKQGDFMLIIAGDGIRRDAHAIVQFLQDAGHLRFVFAMIETAVYKHKTKDLFVIQPRTLIKTQVIERQIDYANGIFAPSIEEKLGNQTDLWRQQYLEFWTKFIDSLTLDDPDQPLANPVPAGNITFSLPPSGAVAWITTFFYKAAKEVGCYIRLVNKPIGRELYQGLVDEKEEIEKDLPFKVLWDEEKRLIQRTRKIKSEWPPFDDESIVPFLSETVNGMVNAFRPRLERLSGN
jgi:hypothetical protein